MTVSRARILAVLQPFISIAAGALAAWLLVHVHVLGIFVTTSQAATDIASGIVFIVTAALTWLSTHQHLVPITRALRYGLPIPPSTSAFTTEEIIAFLSPYISVVAGALASWLFVHVHVLGIFHVAQAGVAQVIASAIVMAAVTLLTWLSTNLHILPTLFPGKQLVVASETRL